MQGIDTEYVNAATAKNFLRDSRILCRVLASQRFCGQKVQVIDSLLRKYVKDRDPTDFMNLLRLEQCCVGGPLIFSRTQPTS